MKTISPSKLSKGGSCSSQQQAYDLKQAYEQYDAVLLLSHRRFGIPIEYSPGNGLQPAGRGGCAADGALLYRPSCSDPSRILPRDALTNSESEFVALHAARMCSALNTVRSAISTTECLVAPSQRCRSNSAASASELMDHFQSVHTAHHQQQATTTATNAMFLAPPQPHHHTVPGIITHAPPRSRSFSPTPQTSSANVSPNPVAERRRTSSGTSVRAPLSQFARQRLGKVLADIVLSCSAISEASGLSNVVASVANDAPKLVLSSNSDSPSDSAHLSRHQSRTSRQHVRNPQEESAHSFIHGLVRNAKSFPGSDRLDDSALPFLQFDALVNSTEDLTTFDEEDGYLSSGGGAASREHSALGHRKYHHVAPGGHSHPTSAIGHPHAHHPHHHTATGLHHSHHHHLPQQQVEPHPGGSLQSTSDSSYRHLQVPLYAKHPSNASRSSAQQGKGPSELPHSPSASLMFKPALSFTSVESPRNRRLPRSVSPPFNRASPGPYSYVVDEARVQVFFQTLRDIKGMIAKGRFSTEKDFSDLGLRYVIPGIVMAFVSPTPHSTPYATFVPPALTVQSSGDAPAAALLPPPFIELPQQGGRQSAMSHRTSIAASDHMDPQSPLGLPPKNPSTEVLDNAGHVSRMSSFSVKRGAAASPSGESLSIVENGHHKIVSLKEFPIFLAAVEQTMVDVDTATGGVYNLQERFAQL